ncbi:MAG: hypothetical protein HQL82_15900 [Magnetococcales bacterium]|nr:hypothetical protein [Magnetococcales bacterium]
MTAEELHEIGGRLYGEGLIATIYIRALAKDLRISEASIRQWWYGIGQGIPMSAMDTLKLLELQRGRFQYSH